MATSPPLTCVFLRQVSDEPSDGLRERVHRPLVEGHVDPGLLRVHGHARAVAVLGVRVVKPAAASSGSGVEAPRVVVFVSVDEIPGRRRRVAGVEAVAFARAAGSVPDHVGAVGPEVRGLLVLGHLALPGRRSRGGSRGGRLVCDTPTRWRWSRKPFKREHQVALCDSNLGRTQTTSLKHAESG